MCGSESVYKILAKNIENIEGCKYINWTQAHLANSQSSNQGHPSGVVFITHTLINFGFLTSRE